MPPNTTTTRPPPVQIPLHTTFPTGTVPSQLRSSLQNALLTSPSTTSTSSPTTVPGISAVQAALSHALETQKGTSTTTTTWPAALEARILDLVRSGAYRAEGQQYAGGAVEEGRVVAQVLKDARDAGGALEINVRAKEMVEAVRVLKEELAGVCEVVEVDD